MKARVKSYLMLMYGTKYKTYLSIYPQQHWTVENYTVDNKYNEIVSLQYKNISIELPLEDYEKWFIEIGE